MPPGIYHGQCLSRFCLSRLSRLHFWGGIIWFRVLSFFFLLPCSLRFSTDETTLGMWFSRRELVRLFPVSPFFSRRPRRYLDIKPGKNVVPASLSWLTISEICKIHIACLFVWPKCFFAEAVVLIPYRKKQKLQSNLNITNLDITNRWIQIIIRIERVSLSWLLYITEYSTAIAELKTKDPSVTAKWIFICILVDDANNSTRATRNSTFWMHKCILAKLGLAGPVARKPTHRSHKTTPIAWLLIHAAAKKCLWFGVHVWKSRDGNLLTGCQSLGEPLLACRRLAFLSHRPDHELL